MRSAYILVLISALNLSAENAPPGFDANTRALCTLTLACVHKEYPNKISHVLNSDADVAPREINPGLLRMLRLHSSVHGIGYSLGCCAHFQPLPFAAARDALKQSLTAGNLKEEANYIRDKAVPASSALRIVVAIAAMRRAKRMGRSGCERDSERLRPLEDAVLERLTTWLPSCRTRCGSANTIRPLGWD